MRVEEKHFGLTGKCAKCRKPIYVTRDIARPRHSEQEPSPDLHDETEPRRGASLVWKVGDVIDDIYEVLADLGEGGMGRVQKVRHRDWDEILAVKTPLPSLVTNRAAVENFVREADTWVNLGLHPNIVCCYYVRVMNGLPRVFAEYVDGGSLEDWVQDRRLYEGDPEQVLERIMDIAIQSAWGLHYAHEQGLIHQDVKPANIMMTSDGVAKLTDFGLARAQGAVQPLGSVTGSIMASCGGMTPAYCSPEQAAIRALGEAGIARDKWPSVTHHTDIFSWAASLFELFNGCVSWPSGSVVGAALESYLENADLRDNRFPRMPHSVARLLLRCLNSDPEERPQDAMEVAQTLVHVYNELTGRDRDLVTPEPIEARANVLNNQAISLLDLGKGEEARQLLTQALRIDPHHIEATYNIGIIGWHHGEITDMDLLGQFQEIRASQTSKWRYKYILALVHMERGDAQVALKLLEAALSEGGDRPNVQLAFEEVRQASGQWRRSAQEFRKHKEGIRSISLSPDGLRLLTGSNDRTLRIWDVNTGTCLRTFRGHSSKVMSVCFSPDGRFVLSGRVATPRKDILTLVAGLFTTRTTHTLRLWSIDKRSDLGGLTGDGRSVRSVAISPNARLVISGNAFDENSDTMPRIFQAMAIHDDESMRLWDVTKGSCLRTFKGHTNGTTSVCFSPDGVRALSGSRDSTLRLWDITSGSCLHIFTGHESWITSVCFIPNAQMALSGSVDKTIRLWDLLTGECLRILKGHTGGVTSVCSSAEGHLALSGSDDTTVRLWDLATGQCLRTFDGHTDVVTSVSFSPDGRWAFSGSLDTTARSWALHGAGPPCCPILSYVINPKTLWTYQREKQECVSKADVAMHNGDIAEAVSELRRVLTLPGYERDRDVLDLWSGVAHFGRAKILGSGWCRNVFNGHTGGITAVCFSPDASWLASASQDATVRLWDMRNYECVHTLYGYPGEVTSVCFSPDGRWLLSGSMGDAIHFNTSQGCFWGVVGKTLRVWDMKECRAAFERDGDHITSVSVSPDGAWCVLACGSGRGEKTNKIVFWSPATQEFQRHLGEHVDGVSSVSFSPDGCHILSGGEDKTLRLWNVATKECTRCFEGHRGKVTCVSFGPDGARVLSGSEDGTLRLWDVKTGDCIWALEAHSGGVTSVCFSQDGLRAVSGGCDMTLRLWDVISGVCLRAFEGHTAGIRAVSISKNGRWVASGSEDNTVRLWELYWDYEFPNPADWDEGVRPYLVSFLTTHTPYISALSGDQDPSEEDICSALTRRGKASWTEQDFQIFVRSLSNSGYGWLRPDGVRRELEKTARTWQGPPSSM